MYPDLHLESLADTLSRCEYQDETYIDYWDGHWKTSLLDTVLTVNKAYPLLIRL